MTVVSSCQSRSLAEIWEGEGDFYRRTAIGRSQNPQQNQGLATFPWLLTSPPPPSPNLAFPKVPLTGHTPKVGDMVATLGIQKVLDPTSCGMSSRFVAEIQSPSQRSKRITPSRSPLARARALRLWLSQLPRLLIGGLKNLKTFLPSCPRTWNAQDPF